MKTNPTPLAMDIFTHIQRRDKNAVFLVRGEPGPLLAAGFGRTSKVLWEARLQTANTEVNLSTSDPSLFALMIDRSGPQHSPRLLLYWGDGPDPILEYVQGSEYNIDLKGNVLIAAQSEDGIRDAVIHAVFNGQNSASLIVLPSCELLSHLCCCTGMSMGGMQ